MSRSQIKTKDQRFREIAEKHFRGKEPTIDEIDDVCLAEKLFSEEELADFGRIGRRDAVRRLARKPYVTEDGERRRMCNIRRSKRGPGDKQNFFAYVDEMCQADLEWLIEDRSKKLKHFKSERDEFLQILGQRFGIDAKRTLQLRLRFPIDEPEAMQV